jgi:putative sigma-54 modulation protein
MEHAEDRDRVGGEFRLQAVAQNRPSAAPAGGTSNLSLDFAALRLHHTLMKLILSTHNVTLTKAIEDHVLGKLDKVERLDHRAVDARVTLEHDHTRIPERQFSCSIRLAVRGPDLFAEARERDLYAAIDLVAKKIEQQIRKRQNKFKARKHKVGARSKRTRQEAAL